MEWILQVVDEIDDAVAAMRLCSIGVAADLGLLVSSALASVKIHLKIPAAAPSARR